ncbi:MAG: SPFH domain-containing protein [Oscillospiraceae bacterium]|jgi:membrane protease subunit (stomatin/prohibitin family)|nr:SPFH domain-containing protein [Oscillospiraceae bacterium]
MAILQGQLANVAEWNESRPDVILWKWKNNELKKSSRLVVRPGQDAIFMYNGRVEGVFRDEGNFEIESDIIPFLSTLKGFKFGFNSGIRAEVVFINTKQLSLKWGTKNAVMIPTQGMPGGLPIRAFGICAFQVSDPMELIDKIAGVKDVFTVGDVQERVTAVLDGLLMRWIAREGKDMFNLQAYSREICAGIRTDLDMELLKLGLTVKSFDVSSFSYPEEIQKKITQNAAYTMVGDTDRYQKIAMTDAMAQGGGRGGPMSDTAQSMAGMMAGMQMAREMFTPGAQSAQTASPAGAKFCANCGTKLDGAKFCPECGAKVG